MFYIEKARQYGFHTLIVSFPKEVKMTLTIAILTILAIFLGPILAVQISQYLERNRWKRERKLNLFKDLMATRLTTLAPQHIQALNMIGVEFDPKASLDKDVIEAWKVYLDHLYDKNYPKETWESRRAELMIDLLQKMAKSLDYDFDKSHIKSTSYYPTGYGDIEDDQYLIRKGTVELLEGKRSLSVEIKDKR